MLSASAEGRMHFSVPLRGEHGVGTEQRAGAKSNPKSHFRPSSLILDVNARPRHALNVGTGCPAAGSITLFTT